MTITLIVPGEPRGKGRPRFARGRAYIDRATLEAEGRVQAAWYAAGRPAIPGRPALVVRVNVVLRRPAGHQKKNGSLSAAGVRAPYPAKRPDADNILKLVCDSLNGCAYEDDAQVVEASVVKRWAASQEVEHTRIEIREAAA